jgi:uncharacterized phage protein gp47/JayE
MFERKSMEQIVQGMIDWTKGVTTKLTDFRVGSKIRSIYEAVGTEIEKLYDKVYRAVKQATEDNMYSIMDFDKLPAVNASGKVTFGRSTAADTNYLIAAGTIITTRATSVAAPLKFSTTEDGLLASGTASVDIPVVCLEAGEVGNQDANTITEFTTKPAGVETVTNATGFSNGRNEETKEEQKIRFQKFVQSRMRGTLESCEYGAITVELKDTNGNVTEQVKQSTASEDLINRKGEVDVYIWNGVGAASAALISETEKVLTGYHDATTGEPVYGYKPAGILVNVYSAVAKYVTIKFVITPESWTTVNDLKASIENEVDGYFAALTLGQTVIQSALLAKVKFIDGVKDVELLFSVAAEPFHEDNITAVATEVLVATKPIQYV